MTDPRNEVFVDIEDLVQDARPIDDNDWGSDRQVTAEYDLYEALMETYGYDFVTYWEHKSIKMTTEESLDLVLSMIESGDWK